MFGRSLKGLPRKNKLRGKGTKHNYNKNTTQLLSGIFLSHNLKITLRFNLLKSRVNLLNLRFNFFFLRFNLPQTRFYLSITSKYFSSPLN
jgi:hypothetical protein